MAHKFIRCILALAIVLVAVHATYHPAPAIAAHAATVTAMADTPDGPLPTIPPTPEVHGHAPTHHLHHSAGAHVHHHSARHGHHHHFHVRK